MSGRKSNSKLILSVWFLFCAFHFLHVTYHQLETSQEEKYANFTDYNSQNTSEELNVYEIRALRVRKVCAIYGLGNHPPNAINKFQIMEKEAWVSPEMTLLHLPSHSLLYCWVRKAASTSWNKVFFDLAKKKVSEINLHEAAAVFRPKKERLDDLFKESFSFTIVRHPFIRLVSAFRDKFELGAMDNWIYKMYAADLLNITEASKKKDAAYLGQILRYLSPLPRPTFSQFVDYLLRTKVEDYNDHWIPVWLHCHLCKNSFDVIGMFETIDQDTEHIEGVNESE